MNICHVNAQYILGGSETVMRQLHEGLILHGHRSNLQVAWGKSFPPEVFPLYPRLLSWLHHSRMNGLVEAVFPRDSWTDRAFRRLASSDYDLIHVHSFLSYSRLESLFEVAMRKPVVWTLHSFWGPGPGESSSHGHAQEAYGMAPQVLKFPLPEQGGVVEKLQQELIQLGTAPLHIISPSLMLANELHRCPAFSHWSTCCIPNGVNPSLFGFERKSDPGFRQSLQLTPGTTVILVVNRNYRVADKGFSMIREALAGLRSFDAIEVVLVGEGAGWAADQLPEKLRVLPLEFVSDRTRMAGLYEAADLFLFASRYENFPCVTLEAMSAGCCVVATPTPGVVEQIVEGVSGCLAEAVSGQALGATLQNALDQPREFRRNLGLRARKEVERGFTEDKMVERHLQFYADTIAGYPDKIARHAAIRSGAVPLKDDETLEKTSQRRT